MENHTKVIASGLFSERDIATMGVAVTGMGHFIASGTIKKEDLEMSDSEISRFMFCLNQVTDKLEALQEVMKREREDRQSNTPNDGASGD